MHKSTILKETDFGHRIAEDERDQLSSYFVETDQWHSIFSGNVDVVYGAKGSGKSAIYSLLLGRENELFDRGVMIVPAENPRGTPVFRDLAESDPATTEMEFRNLWKLYFLALVAKILRDYEVRNASAQHVITLIEQADLLPREFSLFGLVKSVLDYVRRFGKVEAVEGGFQFDPITGQVNGLTGKIAFREPSASQAQLGQVSIDSLLSMANRALEDERLNVWIVLDRLDVAFAESAELEGNALRALFRVYLDLRTHSRISLKIFLRNDIWDRISGAGFREASHITRRTTLSWDNLSLLNLVIRRILHNDVLCKTYNVNPIEVLSDSEKQYQLFYRIFPKQVDLGTNKPRTFPWMLSRIQDGLRQSAPRELIHLLASARQVQLHNLEIGLNDPPDELLFERITLKDALPDVSQVRLEQTLYAEYPSLKQWLQHLAGERTQQVPETLARIWSVEQAKALEIADQLATIGFFEKRGNKEAPIFWVPFLYRDALKMVQGSAESGELEEIEDES